MAVASITYVVFRLDDADAITGWLGIGGGQGASAEASFPYQGTNLVNRKVTGTGGFYYDPTQDGGAAVNMTQRVRSTLLAKVIVTDPNGLQAASGFVVRIGSGTGAYYEFTVAGTDSPLSAYDAYPSKYGFIFVPINPNVAVMRSATTGSPALTAADYFGFVGDFVTSTAKSENVGSDALDLFTEAKIVGGDGADPDANFTDFLENDDGVTATRYGATTLVGTTLAMFGQRTIGDKTVTVFTDNDAKVSFPDGFFDEGYAGVNVDLINSSTVVTIGADITGESDGVVAETRPNFIVRNDNGTLTVTGNLLNHNLVQLRPDKVFSGATIEAKTIEHAYADIKDQSVIRTLSAVGVASMTQEVALEYHHESIADNSLVTRLDGSYRRGQAFTAGETGILKSASFWLDKFGTPTGNAKVRLYASSGTVGTNAVATGAALAVSSTTLDIATIPALLVGDGEDRDGKQEFVFDFTDDYELQAGTDYVIMFEMEAGGSSDASNYVSFLNDSTSPLHAGNFVRYDGSWISDSTRDAIFRLNISLGFNFTNVQVQQGNAGHAIEITEPGSYTLNGVTFSGYGADGTTAAAVYNNSGGAVTITVTGGGNSPTVRNGTGASTTVSNPKTLTITNIPAGLEARVRRGAYTVLYEDNIQDGDFVYSYNYSANKPIVVSVGGVADDGTPYERRELNLEELNQDQSIPFDQFINPSYTTA